MIVNRTRRLGSALELIVVSRFELIVVSLQTVDSSRFAMLQTTLLIALVLCLPSRIVGEKKLRKLKVCFLREIIFNKTRLYQRIKFSQKCFY